MKRNRFFLEAILFAILNLGFVSCEEDKVVSSNKRAGSLSGMENGYEWVDLGLSVKWATCNLGASKPEEYGNYYAWGEVALKSSFTSTNYKFWSYAEKDDGKFKEYKISKYLIEEFRSSSKHIMGSVDRKSVLDLGDDVVRSTWGGKWRMPTRVEQDELIDMCTWVETVKNGKKGYQVIGPNGNSIFLPAAGYKTGGSIHFGGEYGYYWTNTLCVTESIYAYYLYFSPGYIGRGSYERYHGQSVRGVCP